MIRLITPNNLKEVNFANVSCFADIVCCNSTWYISHDLNILYGERRTTKENKQRLPVRIFFLRFQTLEFRHLSYIYSSHLWSINTSYQKSLRDVTIGYCEIFIYPWFRIWFDTFVMTKWFCDRLAENLYSSNSFCCYIVQDDLPFIIRSYL